MKDCDIHIGDVLQIRSFEDMKSEFGADKDGDILGDTVYFIASMSNLCGKEFTVSDVVKEYFGYAYRSFQEVECRVGMKPWIIQSWMLEPCEDDTEWEVADDDQIALLFS